MCEMIKRIFCLIFLGIFGVLTVVDCRKKEVPIWSLILLLILAGGVTAAECGMSDFGSQVQMDTITGLLIGLLFCSWSYLSGEKIGYGDSLMILVLGIGLGGYSVLWILEISAAFLLVAVLLTLARKERIRGKRLPFYPFLFLGYIGYLIAGAGR